VLPTEGNPGDQYKVCGKRLLAVRWQTKLAQGEATGKKDPGLVYMTFKFTFDAAAGPGGSGAVVHLDSDSALRRAMLRKAVVGLVRFAQMRACLQLKSDPGAAVPVYWL